MARLLSPVASILRGSVAGLTFLSGPFHQIVVRARTAPTQPNTPNQSAIRSSLAGASDGWLALSSAQRDFWDQYAIGTKWPGPLGDYTIPGRLCYMAMKVLRLYINLLGLAAPAGPETAPLSQTGFYNLKNVACTTFAPAGATGVTVQFTTEASVDACILAEISPPFEPTRNRYKGPWVTSLSKALIVPAGTSSKIDFDGLNADKVYFIRVKAVADDAPGRVSPEFIVRCIAVTNP